MDEQLQLTEVPTNRRQFIGGSDVAGILGRSPWTTPYQVWLEKTGQMPAAEEDPARKKILRRGQLLEPIVLQMLQEENPEIHVTARRQRYIDPEYPFLAAEIDFECYDETDPDRTIRNGEIKTSHPMAAKGWGEEGTDSIPDYYLLQIHHGLMVRPERRSTQVALLLGADDLKPYTVYRDDELIAYIRAKELEFWNDHVLKGVAPAITTAGDAELSLKLHKGLQMVATQELEIEAQHLIRLKETLKALEADTDACKDRIRIAMGQEALRLGAKPDGPDQDAYLYDRMGNLIVSWKEQTQFRLHQAKLAEAYPAIAARFTLPSTFRKLLTHKPKKGKK